MPAHLCQLKSLSFSGDAGRSLMNVPTAKLVASAAARSQCSAIAVSV